MSRTAAEYMAKALEQAGVKRVYGVGGDSLNGFNDALRRLETIEWIHVRCDSTSWAGRHPSLGGYVTGTGATRGVPAAGGH